MRLSVSWAALGACCLLAIPSLPAQDAPAARRADPESAPTSPGKAGGKSQTARDPGATVLTTFPGDTGPGPKDAPDNSGAVGPNHVVDFTNAHVVIQEYRRARPPVAEPSREVLPVSGRTPELLRRQLRSLADAVERNPEWAGSRRLTHP